MFSPSNPRSGAALFVMINPTQQSSCNILKTGDIYDKQNEGEVETLRTPQDNNFPASLKSLPPPKGYKRISCKIVTIHENTREQGFPGLKTCQALPRVEYWKLDRNYEKTEGISLKGEFFPCTEILVLYL